MGLRSLRERFRGREFWRGANRFIGVGLYTTLLVGVMAFPMYLGYLILVYVIVIPSYVAFFVNHLREMEKKDKGNKVIEGWITHAYGVGERVYLYPTKFEIVDKLPPADLVAVKKYVEDLKQYGEAAQAETGLGRFRPKQLALKEYSSIEKMSNNKRKKFDEEEIKEMERFVKEHKEMKAHEKAKEMIDEGESKNE